jgi:PAS domain S-box-containing protein
LTLSTWALEASGCSVLLLEATAQGQSIAQIGPGFEQLTGYAPEDYVGREYDFLAGPATDVRMVEQLHRASRLAISCRAVIRSHRRDGTSFWNEVTLCPLEEAWGGAKGIRVLQCDVTERVETRDRLERMSSLLADRQQFNSAILDGIHSAIITADPTGRVTFINRLACKTLGVSAAESQGADLVRFLALPPDVFSGLTAADRVKRLSYGFRRPDGQSVDIGISMSRAFDDAHHDLGYFVAFRDLSEQLQLDTDLRRVERLAAIGTMVSGFAHEVRNPIATLRILLEALQADVAPADPSVEYLTRMMKQVQRIERLVSTSLQFGRPVAPRRALHCPATLASSALDGIFRQEKGGSGHRLEVRPALPREARPSAPRLLLEADLPHVLADDAQIAQVLVILLENALDAAGAPDLVSLRVRAAESGGDVRFEVTDRGPGISESMMSRIFDPFFTTKPHGTGLGLSIAQQLIHENGGRIEASSVEGQGTTFVVVVPSAVSAREASIFERS